jgi:RNA polymerase sigma-70 factor, ECF subfamily
VKAQTTGTAANVGTFDLIKRAQRGDEEAFASLFHTHKMRIYSLCLRMTSNTAEAEDLAQESFLQVFRKLATFRAESAFSTWVYRIAVNTVLMHFRKKSPCRISLDEDYGNQRDSQPVRREYGMRDGRLETSVTRVALTRAISELPEGYRVIFILHEIDGYQHREIAKLLGCSVGTSKSQLHKAKSRIREFLTTTTQTQPQFVRPLAQASKSQAFKSKEQKKEEMDERVGNWSSSTRPATQIKVQPVHVEPSQVVLRAAA